MTDIFDELHMMFNGYKVFVDKEVYKSDEPYFNDKVLDPDNAGFDLKICEVYEGTLKDGRKLAPYSAYGVCQPDFTLTPDTIYTVNSGLKMAIPKKHFGFITLRSSMIQKSLMIPAPIVDCNYRGYVWIMLHSLYDVVNIPVYERIAQMTLIPYNKSFTLVDSEGELGETDRGDKGLGVGSHTGEPNGRA
jgi:dUTPase